MEIANMPTLRFPEFSNVWEEVHLGNICSTFKSGVGITSERITESGEFPVYGGNGLRGYTNTFTHDGFYLLIGRQGALCGNINRATGKTYISEHAIAVRGDERTSTKWLAQKLDYMRLNRLSESSAQPGLSVAKLVKLKLFVPTYSEQQKIAAFLLVVDRKIQLLTRKKELLDQYIKGVIQKIFSQEIRFKDENGNEYPDWEEKRLRDCCNLIKDGTHGTHADIPGSGYYLLSAKNIIDGKIQINSDDREISKTEFEAIFKNYRLQQGDLLLSIVGTIGRTSIYQGEINIAFQRSVAFFRFQEDNPEYMYYYFNSYEFQNELMKRQVVSAQPGIYLRELSNIYLIIPSQKEQDDIAVYLRTIDNKIEIINNQIIALEQFKKGLLQQMFI
ncbi:MAG: restriction endonuclease subunit S [Candidatus Marinimicrobia bacterium]|nr:restriction endonuclease subunit S [Candidatus Neomarinimicrobiota bacterium]